MISFSAIAQTTQIEFGQNRVQYKKFNWQYMEAKNFDMYYYDQSKEVASYINTIISNEIDNLIAKLSYSNRVKFDILVFNSAQDFAQTNIGLNNEVYNIGGRTKINENKIFIYFNGNHRHLQNDLTKSLSEIFIKQMMKGSSFGQRISNFLFLRLPTWYQTGVSDFVAYGWNTNLDDKLRNYFTKNPSLRFNQLAKLNPTLAGHSFWNMIAEQYTENAIGNILYLTRINHNVNAGFKIAISRDLDQLSTIWTNFYAKKYKTDIENREANPEKSILSKKGAITALEITASNDKLAYVLNGKNKNKVAVKYTEQSKSKTIYSNKNTSNITTTNSPIIAWSKDNSTLATIYNKNGKNILQLNDFTKHKSSKQKITDLDYITGVDFTHNSDLLILSAVKNGQSDLFQYYISSNSLKQISNDIFDQTQPKVIRLNNQEKILYSSNIPLNEIGNIISYRFENFDLFMSDLFGHNTIRLTETPHANEFAVGKNFGDQYAFLSDENGIYNIYAGSLSTSTDSITNEIVFQANNFPTSNVSQNMNAASSSVSSIVYLNQDLLFRKKNRSNVYSINKTATQQSTQLTPTDFMGASFYINHPREANNNPINLNNLSLSTYNSKLLDSLYTGDFPYTFQTKFDGTISISKPDVENSNDVEANQDVVLEEDDNTKNTTKVNPKHFPKIESIADGFKYKSKFGTDYFVTQLDNSLMTTYQSVAQNGGEYQFPKIGVLASIGVSDILDNHRLSGSIRFPFTFDGSEVALNYTALKHKIDGHISFYRRSNRNQYDLLDVTGSSVGTMWAKTITYISEVGFSLPFNERNSIRVSSNYRNEKLNPLYMDATDFTLKSTQENWIGGKVEFVHDNTEDIQFNIPKGLKFKTFFEYFKNINNKGSNIYNIGFDLRYYLKIHKNLIWANRLAFASSFGSQKILYFLGGVDTWLNQKYDNTIPIDGNTSFGLQAPVNNMRGLPQNIRNGNNYLLWNSEIRLPLFSYLARKTIQSDFIKDFQLIGFVDAGMAYTEANPFNKENAYRKVVVNPATNNAVIVTMKTFRNPFVVGFGAGVRTNLMGYFLRVDAGWGYNGISTSKKPIWHISLSKDF